MVVSLIRPESVHCDSRVLLRSLQCCAGQRHASKRPSRRTHPSLDASNEPYGHGQGSPCAVEAMPQKPSEQVSLFLSLAGR